MTDGQPALAAAKAPSRTRGGILPPKRDKAGNITGPGSYSAENPPARHVVEAAAEGRRQKADEFAATQLPKIRAMRKRGLTLAQIAEALNAAGIVTRWGKSWSGATVYRVLQRETAAQVRRPMRRRPGQR
jgi:Recombinase